MQHKVYDPALHITAGELRERGLDIPADIPDCGWISREDYLAAMVNAGKTLQVKTEGNREFSVTGALQLPPFYWIEINGTIEL